MNGTTSGSSLSIGRLILIPAVFTLAVTILRLVGELQHWGAPWFSNAAGGGGAIVGISWLPIFFGPYFAWKLATADEGPTSTGKGIGMACVAAAVFVVGAILFGVGFTKHQTALLVVGIVLQLGSAFIPGIGWKRLGKTLIAYAFAARIPVLIVMWFAMAGNGGQGWGTHYDAVGAGEASLAHPLWKKFVVLALIPQMSLWIGWTVVVGALVGTIVVAIFHRKKQVAAAA